MVNSVTIDKISASDAIDLKKQLDQSGLVMGQDYVWRFQPVKYSTEWNIFPEASQVVFDFRDSAIASFYRLKWTK